MHLLINRDKKRFFLFFLLWISTFLKEAYSFALDGDPASSSHPGKPLEHRAGLPSGLENKETIGERSDLPHSPISSDSGHSFLDEDAFLPVDPEGRPFIERHNHSSNPGENSPIKRSSKALIFSCKK